MTDDRMTVSENKNALPRAIPLVSYDLQRWLYVLALLCLISVLAFVYLAQASYVTKQIEEMENLEHKRGEIEQDNSALLLQIAQYEQMSRLQQEARALGLDEPEHVEYVEVVLDETATSSLDNVAYDPRSSSPASPSYLPAWWHSIVHQFGDWIKGGTAQIEPTGR